MAWQSVEDKVIEVAILVKVQPVRIAVAAEEAENPLLLFGREEAFAVVIAVVGGVSTQVRLDTVAQGRVVFLLHLGEEGAESIGGVDDARLFVAYAGVALACRGIDGGAAYPSFGEVFPGEVAGATVRLRAVALKAAAVGRGDLFGGQYNVCLHILVSDCVLRFNADFSLLQDGHFFQWDIGREFVLQSVDVDELAVELFLVLVQLHEEVLPLLLVGIHQVLQ